MDIRVSFKHMESSESLTTRTKTKISRIVEKYINNPIDCHVTFVVEHEMHQVDCHLSAGGGVRIHCSAEGEHMYQALDELCEKFEAQVKKLKEKHSHKDHESIRYVAFESEGEEAGSAE